MRRLQFRPFPLLVASLLLVLVGALSVAVATSRYRAQAIVQLHYDVGNPLWQLDRRVMACTYCHVQERGGAPWNPFGQALQAQFRADTQAGSARKFPEVLYALLTRDLDSDGDGYADVLEVYARTLPGDAASVPEQTLDDLKAEFGAAGGVAQYAPGAPKPPAPKPASPASKEDAPRGEKESPAPPKDAGK